MKVIEMPARRVGENLTHLSTLLMIDIMAQLKKHTLTFLFMLFVYRAQQRFYREILQPKKEEDSTQVTQWA